jgi:hypothetical protein
MVAAKGAGVMQDQKHKVEGNAHLKISLSGFPKGTRTSSETDGLFQDVTIDRGPATPWASQEN